MTRQRKTPQQRAQEQLDVAKRAVERLAAQKNRHEHALREITRELQQAIARRDHLRAHPDLQQNPTTEENPA